VCWNAIPEQKTNGFPAKTLCRSFGLHHVQHFKSFRDERNIRYSQPEKRIILYEADSINEHLNRNSQETF
jgi:hypothetical protein